MKSQPGAGSERGAGAPVLVAVAPCGETSLPNTLSGSTLPPSVDTSLQLFSHLPSGLSWDDTSYSVPLCRVIVLFTGPRLRSFQSSTI